MARGRSDEDTATLQMALVGYQIEKQRIEARIQEIRSLLKGRRPAVTAAAGAPPRERQLSAEARERIAAAQRKRWAEHRKRAAQAAKGTRTSSPKVGAAAS